MKPRTAHKSASVPATLVIAMAAILMSGCSRSTQVRRCTDENGNVIPDSNCSRSGRFMYMGRMISPGWVYGGNVTGNRVTGFSRTPNPKADVVSPGGKVITRGGFGGSGSRTSSFGG